MCLLGMELTQFFDFSRWRPSANLDLFVADLDCQRIVLGNLYHYTKFGNNRCSSFKNMEVSIFGASGWKMPIHVPKIGNFSAI